jgi:ribokinase
VIPQLLVVGSVNVDLTVAVTRLPGPGETVTGGRFARGHGGKGANQAVAARRAGAEVVLAGAVGDDEHGAWARAALEAEGIGLQRLQVVPDAATGVALIAVAADGANQIAVASGANARVDPGGAAEAVGALDPSRAAVLLSFEVPDPPLVAAAEAAVAAGVPVVANPAPARELPGSLVACRPILTPNEPEAVALTGLSDPRDAARALARRTGAAVVLTLGAAGALMAEPGAGAELVPAPAVAVVDTTGAGDVFSGVLAAGLAARRALRPAVEAAVHAASRSVTTPGAR